MGTLVNIVDLIVLLLLVVHVPRTVWKGSGSLLLTICVALAVIVFAPVSLAALSGLVGSESSLTQVILLAALLAMAALVGISLASNPVA
jgi:hypothetical protein